MIEHVSGDILRDDSEALVNTVNCVGVMGRGIALQFKQAWPNNFRAYERACNQGEVLPGRMFVVETNDLTGPRFIINFPTKRHWRGKSRLEDIERGLEDLVAVIRANGIQSVAIPPLGSGLGGLDWQVVLPRIEAAVAELTDVRVRIFSPRGAPAAEAMTHATEAPPMTAGRAALVGLMDRYLGGLMDPSVSLLEIHKLMYFLQVAGEPLRLTFREAPYGPYAENLRHVLKRIEGHFTTGYADGGDAPNKPIALVPGVTEDAWRVLGQHDETRGRFERVADLVEGFESREGLELLATVHWVMAQRDIIGRDGVVSAVWAWNKRKRHAFTERQIGIAADILTSKGWVPTEMSVT